MLNFKKTILPLWYIVGILVLVLTSLFLYLGTRYALQVSDTALATKLILYDWIMLGSWFVVNIGMLIWLLSKQAPTSDYLYPIYFVSLHGVFAIMIIAGEVFGSYAPTWFVLLLGMTSSVIELLFVFYLSGCYKLTTDLVSSENFKLDERKPIHELRMASLKDDKKTKKTIKPRKSKTSGKSKSAVARTSKKRNN